MTESFHYPPDVFILLADVLPLLCRSKNDLVLFLRGAGVPDQDLQAVKSQLKADKSAISKYQIARDILEKVNAKGDSGLATRREILKRVVEFEDFTTCWPDDQFKAKGMVADLKKIVNVKDSFTKIKQERESERAEKVEKRKKQQAAEIIKKENIREVNRNLSALFGMNDKPQERGKLLEKVLNDLFYAYGILIREDFKRRPQDCASVVEQIDGVIEIDSTIHLVEMKWLNSPVGMAEFSQHLVRLFGRANAHGIFISTSDFTEPVIHECTTFLNQKTLYLCSIKEIVLLLQREDDLLEFLRKKSRAAILEKRPYLEILS